MVYRGLGACQAAVAQWLVHWALDFLPWGWSTTVLMPRVMLFLNYSVSFLDFEIRGLELAPGLVFGSCLDFTFLPVQVFACNRLHS